MSIKLNFFHDLLRMGAINKKQVFLKLICYRVLSVDMISLACYMPFLYADSKVDLIDNVNLAICLFSLLRFPCLNTCLNLFVIPSLMIDAVHCQINWSTLLLLEHFITCIVCLFYSI